MQEIKDKYITVRCTENDKNIVIKAAKQKGKSVSELVIDSVLAGVERRTARERDRMAYLVRRQERLNRIMENLDKEVAKGTVYEELQNMAKESLKEWEY